MADISPARPGSIKESNLMALGDKEKLRDEEKLQINGTETTSVSLVDEYPLPTEDENRTLRRVAGTPPLVAFLLCFVELAERASYYGANGVFSNFIQFPLPAGAIGFGGCLLQC